MVRFVLNTSRIYVDKSMPIHPFYITWDLEDNEMLRLNDPYYMHTRHPFILEDLESVKADTLIYNALILETDNNGTLSDIEPPYLMWKEADNDTIHILKNNIILHFKFVTLN